jgi:tetratricopeptide (TPR) repeat protein
LLIRKKAIHFEREALLASGIKGKNKLPIYVEKLDYLYQQFAHERVPSSHPATQAKALFDWLWKEKPNRYEPRGHFKLSDVIDAELSKNSQTVGNCLGLTLLYNSLLRRLGIHAESLYLENAFGIGPHVLTILMTKESSVDIENILPDGFDYQGHLDHPSRTKWGDKELVADIYHSLGNDYFKKGEFAKALNNYEMSIKLNPQYEKAHFNKAILMDKLGTRR